jgi:hypothetical protein
LLMSHLRFCTGAEGARSHGRSRPADPRPSHTVRPIPVGRRRSRRDHRCGGRRSGHLSHRRELRDPIGVRPGIFHAARCAEAQPGSFAHLLEHHVVHLLKCRRFRTLTVIGMLCGNTVSWGRPFPAQIRAIFLLRTVSLVSKSGTGQTTRQWISRYVARCAEKR